MKKCFFLTVLVLLSACEAPDPAERRAALHLPPQGFIGDPEAGRQLYSTFCLDCHGDNAQGSHQAPPLVSEVYRTEHHADFAVHMAVRDGVRQHHWNFGGMPSIPNITPEQTAHVIAYIRLMQKKTGINP